MPSTVLLALSALALFQLKHFACDFALQTRRQIQAKRKYGQLPGLEHSGLHAVGSLPALILLTHSIPTIVAVMLAEFLIHYHVDWAKVRIDHARRFDNTGTAYWTVFGLDQLVHQATYLAIVFVLLSLG